MYNSTKNKIILATDTKLNKDPIDNYELNLVKTIKPRTDSKKSLTKVDNNLCVIM